MFYQHSIQVLCVVTYCQDKGHGAHINKQTNKQTLLVTSTFLCWNMPT